MQEKCSHILRVGIVYIFIFQSQPLNAININEIVRKESTQYLSHILLVQGVGDTAPRASFDQRLDQLERRLQFLEKRLGVTGDSKEKPTAPPEKDNNPNTTSYRTEPGWIVEVLPVDQSTRKRSDSLGAIVIPASPVNQGLHLTKLHINNPVEYQGSAILRIRDNGRHIVIANLSIPKSGKWGYCSLKMLIESNKIMDIDRVSLDSNDAVNAFSGGADLIKGDYKVSFNFICSAYNQGGLNETAILQLLLRRPGEAMARELSGEDIFHLVK